MAGIPPGGALHRALDPDWAWGINEELAAVQVEMIDKLWRQTVAINSKKGSRQPDPVKIPRPWQLRKRREKTKRERRSASLAEIGRFLQGG